MKISGPQLRRIILPYLWSIGFWLVLAILTTSQRFIAEWIDPDTPASDQIQFPQLLLLTSVRFLTFALLTPAIFNVVRRSPISRNNPIRGVLTYLVGAVPFAISYSCIRWTLAPIWSFRLQNYVPRSLHSLIGTVTGTFGEQISVYAAVVIAAHAYEYFERAKSRELEQHELQQALAASELQALKSQLHPHFLFNTLHGISTLIDTDRARAKAMVIKLSDLLRCALRHGSSDLINLEEEIEFLKSYLDLEKMRLGARLDVRWDIDPDTLQVLVPQLILQPLAENALLHGIACCREGGLLEIASRRTNGMIEICIRNSAGGKSQGGLGLGLRNTKSRLKYLYADEAKFSFALADSHIATATLVFPAIGTHQQEAAEVSARAER